MGVRRVVPDLSSTSLEAAKGFYGDLPGLRPVMDQGWIVTLADPERPGAQISLMAHDATAPLMTIERGAQKFPIWTPPFVRCPASQARGVRHICRGAG